MSVCLTFLPVFLGVSGFSHAQTELAGKTVLILHAHEANAPIFLGTDRGLSKALQAGGIPGLNLFYESLDLRRNPGPEHRNMLVEQIRMRYGHRRVDLIVTMFPEALDFVLNDCRDSLPAVPILALYQLEGAQLPKTERPIIGHFPALDVPGTLEIALKLVPRANKVYVVSGAHPVDRGIEERARRGLEKWGGRLEFLHLSHMPFEAMLDAVAGASPDSVILLLAFSQDVTGKFYTSPIVARQLSRVSRAPVFGILDSMLGHGIAGGSVLSFELVGEKAGQRVLDILGGTESAAEHPAGLDVPPVPMFDWRQLRHWNLDTDDLPGGSVVINRETTLRDFRYYILGILVFFLAETALIVLLVMQIRRKRIAEKALRESEERLDLATSAAGTGIWVMNTDTRSVWVTDKLRELFRFAPDEELSYERFLEVIHPDDRGQVSRSVLESLERRQPLNVEYRILHPDGGTRWIASRGRPYAAASGLPGRLMGVSSDVTPRKITEVQLRESQTLLSALVDSTSDLIWSVDAERFGLLTFNRGLFDYFLNERGIRIEVGMDPGVLLPTEAYAEMWRTFYRRALEHGSFTTEYPVSSGSRTLLLNLNRLERDGVAFGVSVFGKDITDRKRSEEAVRESEAKYRILYESMMDGYVRVDMDGRIRECNEAYRAMTGYTQDELRGLTYLDITPERWHAAEREIIGRQVLARGYSDVYEKEYRKKDGTLIAVELRTFLLRDETGSNTGMWAIVRDVTERRQIELEARRLREELVHLTRVSTLGEFTSTLAHEINQPLAAILSNAQAAQRFLLQDKPDIEEIGEILEDIIRDDNRAAEVIRKIRSLMKKEEPRYESLDLHDVIGEILHAVRNESALAAVTIEREFSPSLPAVWGDRVQLQQVILNLIMNAAEAMRDAAADDPRLTVRTSERDGRFAEVSIRDNGPGIEANALGRLFDPFYSTKAGGLGMGLAISKEIVKTHRGDIRAVNNPDGGTTFSFTVPFASGVTK
ncbi:MAG: Sensor histidine kinase TmoS [Syntrophaceae bacterium PtaU1.Bin231]|nr:MAG: Sensor histidine kinase TmoS [Syntrophaceae bacterium PtaU1.Bin231]